MKEVYFVRHGESEGNVTGVHRDPSGSLTKRGERQAIFLARRFQDLDVDLVVTSHYERARQTAAIINEALEKPIAESSLFAEKTYPSEMHGLDRDHPVRIKMSEEHEANLHDPDYRYSDEETFPELKPRAKKALAYLLKRPEERILVVTHGWFLRVLIATMLHGESLTNDEYLRVWKFLKTKNTGVTICQYDEESKTGGWQLITWMDHAHLAEPEG